MPAAHSLHHGLRRTLSLLAATGVLVACGGQPAQSRPTSLPSPVAGTQLCERFATTVVQGRFLVANNRWGSETATQCINVTQTGFQIATLEGANSPEGHQKPVGYPSIYAGCSFRLCSPDTNLPVQLSAITSARSSVTFIPASSGVHNAAYDIWLDPTPQIEGRQQVEIMIDLGYYGLPIDKEDSDGATIDGRDWRVHDYWYPGHHEEVVYRAAEPFDGGEFDVMAFIADLRARHPEVTDQWYLKSIMAGIECWADCVGAGVRNFDAAVQT